MNAPVITLATRQSLRFLAQILFDTTHSGFPVIIVNDETGYEVIYGLITRSVPIVIIIIIRGGFKKRGNRPPIFD